MFEIPNSEPLFYDAEFTGLKRSTSLISIGFKTLRGDTFYAEFNDYPQEEINGWLQNNVINNLKYNDCHAVDRLHEFDGDKLHHQLKGNTAKIKEAIRDWLERIYKANNNKVFVPVSDVPYFDHMLFTELVADFSIGYPSLPPYIYYITLDLATLFLANGIDPDISREEFAKDRLTVYDGARHAVKHSAFYDAIVIMECYKKLLAKNTAEEEHKTFVPFSPPYNRG